MEHVSTDKNKNMIQNICNKNEGVSLYAMRLLFFVDYKNRLIFLSCDILRISLILEKPLNFDPFGHARFAHLFVLYD